MDAASIKALKAAVTKVEADPSLLQNVWPVFCPYMDSIPKSSVG